MRRKRRNRTSQAQRNRQAFNEQAEAPVYTISDAEAKESDTLRRASALLACYNAGKNA